MRGSVNTCICGVVHAVWIRLPSLHGEPIRSVLHYNLLENTVGGIKVALHWFIVCDEKNAFADSRDAIYSGIKRKRKYKRFAEELRADSESSIFKEFAKKTSFCVERRKTFATLAHKVVERKDH